MGCRCERPLLKDAALVSANGGSTTWRFTADSSRGRWLLHCHNEIHMVDGMMTEVSTRIDGLCGAARKRA